MIPTGNNNDDHDVPVKKIGNRKYQIEDVAKQISWGMTVQRIITSFQLILPLLIIAVIIAVSLIAWKEWERWTAEQRQVWDESKIKMAQLSESLAVGDSKPVTKEEFEEIVAKMVDPRVVEYAKKNNMKIADLMEAVAKVDQNVERWTNSDVAKNWTSFDGKAKGYVFKWIWTGEDENGNKITPAYAMFWTEGPKAGTWTVGVLPFKVKATTQRLQAVDGVEYTYAVRIALVGPHNGEKSQRGVEWYPPLDAENIKIVINEDAIINPNPKPKFQWWAPHVQANIGGAAIFSPVTTGSGMFGIGFTPFGYGLTPNDLTWEFLSVGADYLPQGNTGGVSLAPVAWRPFDKFITNTRWQFIRCGWSPIGWYCGSNISIDF